MANPLNVAFAFGNLQQALLNSNRNINIGSVLTDILTAVATDSTSQQILSGFILSMQSFTGILEFESNPTEQALVAQVLNITPAQLSALVTSILNNAAGNFGIVRPGAIAATGVITFGALTAPATDLSIPSGTVVEAISGSQYATTATVVITAANTSTFFNPTLGLYTINAPIQALVAGSAANTLANTIIASPQVISGITYINNSNAITNGLDALTDPQFVTLAIATLQGNNKGSAPGIVATALSIPSVGSAITIGAGDPLMIRDSGYGGAVDLYLQLQSPISEIDIVPANAITQNQYIMQNQPVSSILSVIGTLGGVQNTNFNGSFTFVKDLNVIRNNSIIAQDMIVWGATRPDNNTSYTINYIADNNVLQVNALFANPINTILSQGILTRQAIQVLIDITAVVNLQTGSSSATVIPLVQAAIESLINGLQLGQSLSQSQLISVIENVQGVLSVNVPLTVFGLAGTDLSLDNINVNNVSYIQINNLVVS